MYSLYSVLIGFALDMLFGDPNFKYHPVRLIGRLISFSEKIIRGILPKSKNGEIAGGAILVIFICLFCGIIVYIFLRIIYGLNLYLGLIAESLLCWMLIAAKALKTESMKVYNELKNGDISSARRAVSMIVGRDTDNLSFEGVTKAAIETVAENTSDGITAPIIYMLIGGAPLGVFYKAVNTMDSMIGYKNDKYIYFGKAAARLDDAANFLPSRIAAVMMIAASGLQGLNIRNAVYIFRRDRLKHKSPNSAQTESVCAGALGIKLAGDAWYFGKLYKKDYIGDEINKIDVEQIKLANRLMYITACLTLAVFSIIKFTILGGL